MHLEAHFLTGTAQAVQDILGRRRDLAICHHQDVRLRRGKDEIVCQKMPLKPESVCCHRLETKNRRHPRRQCVEDILGEGWVLA